MTVVTTAVHYDYTMDTKVCSRCKTAKPLDEFHVHRKHPTGRQAECKVCKHERKAMKTGDTTKITRLKNGRIEEFLRGPNHGESKTQLYRKWLSMRGRCNNPTNRGYRFYGAKGVFVDPEWDTDFFAFKKWALSTGYSPGLHLDRVDADGPYSPSNCRWLTPRENVKRALNSFDEATSVALSTDADTQGVTVEELLVRIVQDHYADRSALARPA